MKTPWSELLEGAMAFGGAVQAGGLLERPFGSERSER